MMPSGVVDAIVSPYSLSSQHGLYICVGQFEDAVIDLPCLHEYCAHDVPR